MHYTAAKLVQQETEVTVSNDPGARALLRLVVQDVFSVLWPEIIEGGTICYLFAFKHSTDADEGMEIDGITYTHIQPLTGNTIHSLGLSEDALSRGPVYAAWCLIHEIAHALTGDMDHGYIFHTTLDGLYQRYNEARGTSLANDYQRLEAPEIP